MWLIGEISEHPTTVPEGLMFLLEVAGGEMVPKEERHAKAEVTVMSARISDRFTDGDYDRMREFVQNTMRPPRELTDMQRRVNLALDDPEVKVFLEKHQVGQTDKGKGPYIASASFIDEAKRKVAADPGFVQRGQYDVGSGTWHIKRVGADGVIQDDGEHIVLGSMEDVVEHSLREYGDFIREYDGAKPLSRNHSLWIVVAPRWTDMNLAELTGMPKIKGDATKFRPVIDCNSTIVTNGSLIVADAMQWVLKKIGQKFGTDMVSTSSKDDFERTEATIQAWISLARERHGREEAQDSAILSYPSMEGGLIHIKFDDIESIYRNEIVEMTADYEGMFTNMDSIQAASALGEMAGWVIYGMDYTGPTDDIFIPIDVRRKGADTGRNENTNRGLGGDMDRMRFSVSVGEVQQVLTAMRIYFPILVNTDGSTVLIQTAKASVMGQAHCPALANTLGCWSYLKIIQAIELGTTKDYEVELDEDGGFVQIISTGRGSVWTAWTGDGEADREFGEFNSRRMVQCPFPNVETAKHIMRYIDDNKFTTVSWLAESVRLWMSCWWFEHLGLNSTWEMPEISSITETDNYGDGRGGLVYKEPSVRLTKWMDYVSGVDRGVKTVQPVVASGKRKRIPHWESFSERSILRGIITTRMTQIAATCGTSQDHWVDSVTELLVQLSQRSVPRSWTCNVMESWLLGRETAASTVSVAGESATFSGGAQLVIVDHFDGMNKAAVLRMSAEAGRPVKIAVRSHADIMARLRGMMKGQQESRFARSRTFVAAADSLDVELCRG